MEMIGEFRQACVSIDEIFAKADRMRRSETKPLESIDFVNGFEQLQRTLVVDLRKLVASVEINDLSEKGDFFDAVSDKRANFSDDFVDRAALLRTARLRHNTKGAMHVAALHDRDERRRLFRRERLLMNRRLRTDLFLNIDN